VSLSGPLEDTDYQRRGPAQRAASDTPAVTRSRTKIAGPTPNVGSYQSAMGMKPSEGSG